MRKWLLFLTLFGIILFSGCSTPAANPTDAPGQSQGAGPAAPTFTALNRDVLKSYASTFEVQFEGPTSWTYQLKTRKSAALREVSLHIEGIDKAKNPGDVRLVTDGTTSWMIGPGTDNECVQFPNNQGMDPTLLYPEMLVSQAELASLFKYIGEEQVANTTSLHFAGKAPTVSGWSDAQVDAWQDKSSRALLKFSMQAGGKDKFFGTGDGRLKATYEASGLGAAIEPVKGCEISVPLPDSAALFVRLPGMASFDSTASVEEIAAFYLTQLPAQGWAEKAPAAANEGATILSYQKGAEQVEVHIELDPAGGSKVKLLFIDSQ
jgi:hypothetical protein